MSPEKSSQVGSFVRGIGKFCPGKFFSGLSFVRGQLGEFLSGNIQYRDIKSLTAAALL